MKHIILLAISAVLLSACSQEKIDIKLDPVAFHQGDECHVCGMIISEWPGPKGEIVQAKDGQVLKFCSTVDMMSHYLQPEHRALNSAIYVHDMTQSHWDKPDDSHLIDATKAWYVMGSNKRGMGQTLVSFAKQSAAEHFAHQEGGQVLSFEQITLETLREIARLGLEPAVEPEQQLHVHPSAGHAH